MTKRDMRFDSEVHPDLYQARSFGKTAAEYAKPGYKSPEQYEAEDLDFFRDCARQYAETAAHWAHKYLRGQRRREYQRGRAEAYRSCGMVKTPYGWE